MGDVIVLLIIAALVIMAFCIMNKRKKSGKTCCGCPNEGLCVSKCKNSEEMGKRNS